MEYWKVLVLVPFIVPASALAQSGTPFEIALLSRVGEHEGFLDPWSVAVGDLDGDGVLDAITANHSSNQGLTWLRGDGAGNFDFVATETLPLTMDVVLDDFDGDGHLDRAVSLISEDILLIAMGNGDGSFGPATSYTARGRLATADLDSDGDIDIVSSASTIRVLLNTGDGSFTVTTLPEDGGDRPQIFDADNDGDLDIVVGVSNGFRLYQNSGGGFEPLPIVETYTPRAVATGDVNADGVQDVVVVSSPFEPTISTFLGNGDGTFGEASSQRGDRTATDATLLDVSGDGVLDLIISHQVGDGIAVRLGDGRGTFPASTLYKAGRTPWRLVMADVNGDGHADAVTADRDSATVSVALGKAGGRFAAAQVLQHRSNPLSTKMADIDGDGDGDIISKKEGFGEDFAHGFFIRGPGGYDTAGTPAPFGASRHELVDLNGDGLADFVGSGAFIEMVVTLSNGDGTFSHAGTYDLGRRGLFEDAIGTDVDGDGDNDLITGFAGDPSTFSVWRNAGDGTLEEIAEYDHGRSFGGIRTADLNGDGLPDVVIQSRPDGAPRREIAIRLNRGDGTFGPATFYDDSSTTAGFALLDANGDSHLDLVQTHTTGPRYLPNAGDGTLGDPIVIPHLEDIGNLSAIGGFDADGDGWTDLFVGGRQSPALVGGVFMLRGGPDGFGQPQRLISSDLVLSMTTGDSNGDGRTDLVCSDYDNDSVAVILARTDPCQADLDGDGALTIFDFLAFGNLFDLQDPRADFDGDGEFAIFDFLAFQNAFDAGCP